MVLISYPCMVYIRQLYQTDYSPQCPQ
ncbi:unnamed protein product [Spirodela intermedia]|uniref:Uncharacterized protein n=1 Tax=Spirodela intermedia TaxID=51605 RepID=A0A7I8JES4_SPIIN|nr:unnamed protein product [Spirodela intermedia]CAA6668656.1 unnamed protein product [Spirodela intermedia]